MLEVITTNLNINISVLNCAFYTFWLWRVMKGPHLLFRELKKQRELAAAVKEEEKKKREEAKAAAAARIQNKLEAKKGKGKGKSK